MTQMQRNLLVCTMLIALAGCAGVKPYEKEYLLHPLMDDRELRALKTDFPATCAGSFERLNVSGVGSANATSCPTCGG